MCVCAAPGKAFHVFILYHSEENHEEHNFQVTFSECRVVKFIIETSGLLGECMDWFLSVEGSSVVLCRRE